MEHEVNVPFSVGSVRSALADPARVARCVPGLQPESTSTPSDAYGRIEGRLRLRVSGSTITYRGSLQLARHGEEFAVEGDGTEARGEGSVRLELTVVPRPSRDGDGTRLVCSGTVRRGGRLGEFEEKAVAAAGQRLLERFGSALGDSIRESPPESGESDERAAPAAPSGTAKAADGAGGTGGIGSPGDNERAIPSIPGPETGDKADSGTGGGAADAEPGEASEAPASAEPAEAGGSAEAGGPAEAAEPSGASGERSEPAEPAEPGEPSEPAEPSEPRELPERTGVFDTEIPPSSLDPLHDDEEPADEVPAEAAHARRTMIGRSAEEVDHAPPRGRYAPVPVAAPNSPSSALRWAAPAAAAVVAGAVVLGRALRRRR